MRDRAVEAILQVADQGDQTVLEAADRLCPGSAWRAVGSSLEYVKASQSIFFL